MARVEPGSLRQARHPGGVDPTPVTDPGIGEGVVERRTQSVSMDASEPKGPYGATRVQGACAARGDTRCMGRVVRVATHGGAIVVGVLFGAVVLAPSGSATRLSATPPTTAPRSGTWDRSSPPRPAQRTRDRPSALDELERALRFERAARATAEAERDAALVANVTPRTSLLDEIAVIDEPTAWRAERRLRETLREARLLHLTATWPAPVGGSAASSSPTARDRDFFAFYAELTARRTPEETKRLHARFTSAFPERIPELRRQLREAETQGAGDTGRTAQIRAEMWREAAGFLEAVRSQLTDDERTEMVRHGSEAIGYPPPAVRLALGWRELVGADVDPEEFRNPSVSQPFVWVYSVLARERSSEELRLLYDVLRRSIASGTPEAATYECVKPLLTSNEWRHLRYHPENGELPLSR